MKKVSIIIPIYNMEKFVDAGMKCLLEQTYKNLEIIIVDDGSSDNSLESAKKYVHHDERVHVFYKSNEGAGPTRNYGIEKATGDYLYFFDIDDYLYPDAIKKLVNAIEKNNTDMVVASYEIDYGNNKIENAIKADNIILSGDEVRKNFDKHFYMKTELGIKGPAWFHLYKTSVVKENNITYPDLRRHQDEIFVMRYIDKINSVCFIKDIIYRYYANDNSRLWKKVKYDYFTIAATSSMLILNMITKWNADNKTVQNYLLKDYYYKTFQSMWYLFNPNVDRTHKERYEIIKSNTEDFMNSLPTEEFGEGSKVYKYMRKKNYLKLYMRMYIYTQKHKKD